jgi:hypothetical protein
VRPAARHLLAASAEIRGKQVTATAGNFNSFLQRTVSVVTVHIKVKRSES